MSNLILIIWWILELLPKIWYIYDHKGLMIFYTNCWNLTQKLQSTTSCVLYPLLLHLLPVLTSRSNSRTTFLLLHRHAPAVSSPHTCPSSSSLEAPHSVKSSVLIQQSWSKSSLHVLMLSYVETVRFKVYSLWCCWILLHLEVLLIFVHLI